MAARTADPLWMIGRQWQMGELTASDNGSPVAAAVTTTAFAIDQVTIGATTIPFDPTVALEAFVEPEPAAAPDMRMRMRAGTYLIELVQAAAGIKTSAALRARCAPAASADPLVAVLVRALGADAVDGESALVALGTPVGITSMMTGEAAAAVVAVKTALQNWLAWYRGRTGRTLPSAWNAEGADYRFSLSVAVEGRAVRLDSNGYRGGRLDWTDLRARQTTAVATNRASSRTEVQLPSVIAIPGGPARRYFEIESGALNYHFVGGGPVDVATTLLSEFAVQYSGDWFVIPVTAPVGTLTRIDRIEVRDSFGAVTTLNQRVRSPGFRMFELDGDGLLAPYLLVLPTVGQSVQSDSIEELIIARDEGANLAWAIPQISSNELGLSTRIVQIEPAAPTFFDNDAGVHRYRPWVPAPAGWYPMVRQGRFLVGATSPPNAADAGALAISPPTGQLLAGWPATVKMYSEDLAAEGVRIFRRWQMTTAADGRRFLWITRERRPGAGGVASGMFADALLAAKEG